MHDGDGSEVDRSGWAVCERCGARRDPRDPAALAWVHEQDPEPVWLCVTCARRHLRDIEARLRREWW